MGRTNPFVGELELQSNPERVPRIKYWPRVTREDTCSL